MKVSEIAISDVANYLRLEDGEYTDTEIQGLIDVAVAYVKSHTGLSAEKIDDHADIVIVIYVLCQDMYDNRSMYVDKNNLNKVVDTILGMHCINLL